MAFTLNLRTEFEAAALMMGDMRRQLPFAFALALTRTVQDTRRDLRAAMQAAFDRPKAWTLNSLYLEPATKAKLSANVHFKDAWTAGGKGGVPAGRYLRPQIQSGPRVAKSHERALQRAGVIPPGYYLVPTWHADFDRYGNWNPGQITKMLSALRANRDVGVTSNLRADGRSRGRRSAESYFAIVPGRPQGRGGRGGGLPPGIYKATGTGDARQVRPVALLMGRAPRYGVTFPFDQLARRSFDRHLPVHLPAAIQRAMQTARPR